MGFLVPDIEDLKKLQHLFQKELGVAYSVQLGAEVISDYGHEKTEYDLAVFRHNELYAVVEYKFKISVPRINDIMQYQISQFKKAGCEYGIIYYGKEYFYMWIKKDDSLKEFSREGLFSALKTHRCFGKRPIPEEVDLAVYTCLNKVYTDQISVEQNLEFDKLFKEESLVYDEEKALFSLAPQYEDKLFLWLLQPTDCTYLCKYSSMRTLFNLMKNKKHCMCSIPCMNDKAEGTYAEFYINHGSLVNPIDSLEERNNTFIMSFCDKTKIDDLTMWRLYAQDGEGVCLEYDVDLNMVNNNSSFFFAPVSYGHRDGNHYELDFIMMLKDLKIDGWKFVLNRWYIWKNYFKSNIFADEQEYRLVYIQQTDVTDRTQWITSSSNGIVSRICEFELNDRSFPLRLTSVWVGPKCPEQRTNIDQLIYMNRIQNVLPHTETENAIKPSEIVDYR